MLSLCPLLQCSPLVFMTLGCCCIGLFAIVLVLLFLFWVLLWSWVCFALCFSIGWGLWLLLCVWYWIWIYVCDAFCEWGLLSVFESLTSISGYPYFSLLKPVEFSPISKYNSRFFLHKYGCLFTLPWSLLLWWVAASPDQTLSVWFVRLIGTPRNCLSGPSALYISVR